MIATMKSVIAVGALGAILAAASSLVDEKPSRMDQTLSPAFTAADYDEAKRLSTGARQTAAMAQAEADAARILYDEALGKLDSVQHALQGARPALEVNALQGRVQEAKAAWEEKQAKAAEAAEAADIADAAAAAALDMILAGNFPENP
jgi:hypothetical protein